MVDRCLRVKEELSLDDDDDDDDNDDDDDEDDDDFLFEGLRRRLFLITAADID